MALKVDTNERPRTMVFIPAYRCETQIPRVLNQLKNDRFAGLIDLVMVVDNISPDGTRERARDAASELDIPWRVWRNENNYGLGGSHKAAFTYAKANGFDYLIVLHGDDQADIRDLLPALESGQAYQPDCYLGSRFSEGSHLHGYSRFREFGNRIYNLLFSIACGAKVEDLGSGLNMYRLSKIDLKSISTFPDNLTFNYVMLMHSLYLGDNVKFFPMTWREEDQASNVRLFRQAVKVLSLLASRMFTPKTFFKRDHREKPFDAYAGEVVYASADVAAGA
ncbi:glycosyltransferase family 2 protein [Hyphomonas chukchiensis]|nr:glycosyltransferase family 2 protein [Hyphomonas chukchiensis]